MSLPITLKRHNGSVWDELHPITDYLTLINKPTSFPPTAHTHNEAELNNISKTAMFRGSISDFNTALTPGQYQFSTSASNSAGSYYGQCTVIVNDNIAHNNASNWIWQTITTTGGLKYYRYKINTGTWTTWYKIYTVHDKPTMSELGGRTNAQITSEIALAVSNLISSSPATLDTLNELAQALGDDPNFATTITNALADKVPISTTNLGHVGSKSLETYSVVSQYANSPIGKAVMLHSGSVGKPSWFTSYFYFMKTANRDSSGGYSGIAIDYLTGEICGGKASTNADLLTWQRMQKYDATIVVDADATVANTANKIVQRNSSGDINARIFRSEYVTLSSSPTYFMTQQALGASNNYIRPTSLAQVKTALGTMSPVKATSTITGGAKMSYSGGVLTIDVT